MQDLENKMLIDAYWRDDEEPEEMTWEERQAILDDMRYDDEH